MNFPGSRSGGSTNPVVAALMRVRSPFFAQQRDYDKYPDNQGIPPGGAMYRQQVADGAPNPIEAIFGMRQPNEAALRNVGALQGGGSQAQSTLGDLFGGGIRGANPIGGMAQQAQMAGLPMIQTNAQTPANPRYPGAPQPQRNPLLPQGSMGAPQRHVYTF